MTATETGRSASKGPSPNKRFAEVAVDAPTGRSRTFSYAVPPSLDLAPGYQVQVPFGPRTLQGIVFSLEEIPQVPETREIISTVWPDPMLLPHQLALATWLSNHYASGLFEAAALMMPPGSRERRRTMLTLAARREGEPASEISSIQRRVVDQIESRGRIEQERLLRQVGQEAKRALGRLVDAGVVIRTAERLGPVIGPKYRDLARLTGEGRREGAAGLSDFARRAPRQAAALSSLLATDEQPGLPALGDLRREFGAGAMRGLIARGWVEKATEVIERDPLAGKSFSSPPSVDLTPAQAAAATAIGASMSDLNATPRTFLLHGVTGSGKTEVYLESVRRCISLGKRAIVMVPEIALTHQTVERFAARFPGRVAVLHSGLTGGERFDQWWKVRAGDYDVVVGSRGAVFAPQPDLALVVLDEEHEWTYKQGDASPRYHARDAALRLGRLTGAVTVLGSASPDVSSYYAARRHVFGLLKLEERYPAVGSHAGTTNRRGELAEVDTVDMRRELREGNREIFSRKLKSAMTRALASEEQVMLFINRRGSASYLQCRSCGATMKCRRCEVSLTYHKGAGRLLCHYCGYRRRLPETCPDCLAARLSFYGVGTQTVVDEVARLFPEERVLRWDRDVARTAADHEELLTRFRSGQARVLVGTQMIAKGLHFPSVSVVGVVSADIGLGVPDYRAGERTFQLLCQVAGRAGRGVAPGQVIVQTFQPENYAIQAAAAQDYTSFYRQEMAFRNEQGNPPFSRLIRLLYAHANRANSEREALELADSLRGERDAWGFSDTEVLGPTPAYPPRLRGRYRWQIVLRGVRPRVLMDKVTLPRNWVMDVDPVSVA